MNDLHNLVIKDRRIIKLRRFFVYLLRFCRLELGFIGWVYWDVVDSGFIMDIISFWRSWKLVGWVLRFNRDR